MNKLALLFHSQVRAEVLRLLFGAVQREMYRAEIISRTPFAPRSVEEELEGCRQKRNTVEYDYAGGASRREAEELIAFGQELRAEVLAWLQKKHPSLVPQ
jgi:hypothetical protein